MGYQIRFDSSNMSTETKIKFMTDGILLKEIEADFLLKKYTCIFVDEAHERSLNSDILVSLLTRIAHARCELAYTDRFKCKNEVMLHKATPTFYWTNLSADFTISPFARVW